MEQKRRARITGILLLLAPVIMVSCSFPPLSRPVRHAPGVAQGISTPPAVSATSAIIAMVPAISPAVATVTPTATQIGHPPDDLAPVGATASPFPSSPTTDLQTAASPAPEPAGCLSAEEQQAAGSEQASLARADRMLGLARPLFERKLNHSWNAYTRTYFPDSGDVLSLSVGDVQNKYGIQKIMDVLQVSGFTTWLRDTPQQGLHILAIPLQGKDWQNSAWAPYVRAYWQDRASLPSEDHAVIPVRKVLPCRWVAGYGYPAGADARWFSPPPAGWPDYARAAQPYLADTNAAAAQVAQRINWLGDDGLEGPTTMCGPLAWAIMQDAGAFPPDWGGWSEGPKAFWLARPRTNGRPWSLFPTGSYHLYRFREPLGKFDFTRFPLYPGDFIYTYSEGDGFDHMLVITEVDRAGNVYTVTNKVQMVPEKKITIERLLLLNLKDPVVGIARNQWANDRFNGRTGHAGFDVFRWVWMEKDVLARPVAYFVQPGDTLALVAIRWKTPAEQIARYNGITVDASLSVGQELQIPSNETAGVW